MKYINYGISFTCDFCECVSLSNMNFSNFVSKAAHYKLVMNDIMRVEGLIQLLCTSF